MVEPLETIRIAGASRDPREPLLDRQVEDQRQIRREIAERETVQSLQRGKRQAAAIALIRQSRIGEAVAHHPTALVERRLDQPLDMVAPRRVKQQGLADRIPTLVGAVEQQPADRLRPC